MADDEVYEVHTPTKSELATFQVLANVDFVNLNRSPDVVEEEHHASIKVLDADLPVPQEEEEGQEFEMPASRMPTPIPSPRSATSAPAEKPPLPQSPEETPEATRNHSPSPPKERRSKSKYKDSTESEIEAEKEGLLNEIRALERSGAAKTLRPLTMDDSLEEIQFQYDRIQAEINANQMVDFAKSAIKMGSGMVEMLLKKGGVQVVDGYHANLCKDMNKFNRPLNRLYKKYWRRGGISPEAELGMLVFGSLAWTVIQNKMGSATAAFGDSATEAPAPAPARPSGMRPPQMNSLNVPASWASSPPAAAPAVSAQTSNDLKREALLREAEDKIKALDAKRIEIEQRDISMRRFVSSLDERSARLDERERSLRDAEEDLAASASLLRSENTEEEGPSQSVSRTVVINTATPRKSGKRKGGAAALDL
jgi:hypothetical protein